jgi:hypothetical protein
LYTGEGRCRLAEEEFHTFKPGGKKARTGVYAKTRTAPE